MQSFCTITRYHFWSFKCYSPFLKKFSPFICSLKKIIWMTNEHYFWYIGICLDSNCTLCKYFVPTWSCWLRQLQGLTSWAAGPAEGVRPVRPWPDHFSVKMALRALILQNFTGGISQPGHFYHSRTTSTLLPPGLSCEILAIQGKFIADLKQIRCTK